MIKKIILLIMSLVVIMLTVVGCGKKIFMKEGEEYIPDRYSSSDLDNDIYYIKDGSAFYMTYMPENKTEKIFWIGPDISLIPNYYSNELIAYQSMNIKNDNVNLSRLSDNGFSLGIYNIKEKDGYYCFNADSDTVEDSSAYKELKNTHSSEIRIETINDKVPTEYSLTSIGSLNGFAENEQVKLGFYSGTVYTEAIITSDVHMLIPFEVMLMKDVAVTKNGYMSIRMPEDAKNGYYLIPSVGIFRYHDHVKGQCTEGGDNLNEPYYNSENDELAQLYQQYVVMVSAKTYDVGFIISYVASKDDVKCVMESPTGEKYDIKCENGKARLELAEAIAGRWVLNIFPKGTVINEIKVDSTKAVRDSIYEEFEFITDYMIPDAQFSVTYTGNGDVWGTVENESKESQLFEESKEKNEIICDWKYLKPGKYKMRVYHYNDTAIKDTILRKLDINQQTETIIYEQGIENKEESVDYEEKEEPVN